MGLVEIKEAELPIAQTLIEIEITEDNYDLYLDNLLGLASIGPRKWMWEPGDKIQILWRRKLYELE